MLFIHSYIYGNAQKPKWDISHREKNPTKTWTGEVLTQQAAHPDVAGPLHNGWEGAQEAAKSVGFAGSHRSDPMGRPNAPASALLYCAASHMQDRA